MNSSCFPSLILSNNLFWDLSSGLCLGDIEINPRWEVVWALRRILLAYSACTLVSLLTEAMNLSCRIAVRTRTKVSQLFIMASGCPMTARWSAVFTFLVTQNLVHFLLCVCRILCDWRPLPQESCGCASVAVRAARQYCRLCGISVRNGSPHTSHWGLEGLIGFSL